MAKNAETGTQPSTPQEVRWGPNDGLPAGISVWSAPDESDKRFISWDVLEPELMDKLLPQLFADPRGYTLAVLPYNGKADWLVRILDASGEPFCSIWLGGDPDRNWQHDGRVHVGDARASPYAWHTYRRRSDDTYRLEVARVATLDEMKRHPLP